MKYIILFIVLFISMSCARKTNAVAEVKEKGTQMRFESDTVPQAIKNEIDNITCSTSNCHSLLSCYEPYFQYLYGNLNPSLMQPLNLTL